MKPHEKINIRPSVTVLSILKYIEYDTWFALAEFVDNAIDSYLKNEKALKEIDGPNFQLEVTIEVNEQDNVIVIRDNAAGISDFDYPRAFRAAEVPPDRSKLSEFGMGMKSAACWFSDSWSVRTKALGEEVEKTVFFDMTKIFEDKLEELEVRKKNANADLHYTVLELYNVSKIPKRRGLGKLKEHLKSIYRDFIRKGILVLKFGAERLSYVEPKVLVATKFDDPKGPQIKWKKDINFSIDKNLSVHGFVAIREKASTTEAGFALFRRGRVIEGSYDDGFRPDYVFGNPNSFRYQRIFGELHLEGFDVIFTKKGIKWDDNLDVFLQCLREELEHKDFPLLQQAERYRVRAGENEYRATARVLEETVHDFESRVPEIIKNLREKDETISEQVILAKSDRILTRKFTIRLNKITWDVAIELSYDPALTDFIEIGDHLIGNVISDSAIRQIGIRLSLVHPFMVEFVGTDNSRIETVLRIIAALGLSEILARESGARTQGEIRRNLNEIITHLSS